MYKLTVLIQQRDRDFLAVSSLTFFLFFPSFSRGKKKSELWAVAKSQTNFYPAQIPDLCFVWVDQSTSNRKAIRWKWKRTFLPFSFGSAVAMAFFSTKLRKLKILFVESPFSDWFSLLFYHKNTTRGAVSEVIFHLKTRLKKWTNLESLWHALGFLSAQTMMGGKRNVSEILTVPWGRLWG